MNGWSAWVAVAAICATLGIGTCSTNSRIGTLETQLGKRLDMLGERIDTLEQDVAAGESKGDTS